MIPVRFGDYSGYCPASQFWWSCCQSSQSSMLIQNAFLVQFTLREVRKQISAISPVEQNSRREASRQLELAMTAQTVHQMQLIITWALNTQEKNPQKTHCLLAILPPLLKDYSIFCKSTRAALRKELEELNYILNSPQASLESVICYHLADQWCLCQRMTQSSHTNQNQSNF